ncbi:MAG: hypothetical protein ACFFBY_01120 [Promethearchaeota archaeon]
MTKIKLCPKCRKAKLKNATNVSGWLAPDMYECTECKYIGYLYLEVDSNDFEPGDEEETEE